MNVLAQEQIRNLEQRLLQMQSIKATLEHLVDCCRGDDRPECRILDSGASHGHSIAQVNSGLPVSFQATFRPAWWALWSSGSASRHPRPRLAQLDATKGPAATLGGPRWQRGSARRRQRLAHRTRAIGTQPYLTLSLVLPFPRCALYSGTYTLLYQSLSTK